MLLPNSQFVNKLTAFYQSAQESGSVFVTIKQSAATKTRGACCIVRATCRTKKISTEVTAEQYEVFMGEFNQVQTTYMYALQDEKKKKKKKKQKQQQQQQRKKHSTAQ